MKEKINYEQCVLDFLKTHPSGITQNEAFLYFGITRLADTVFKLRKHGADIETIMLNGKTRLGKPCTYARYRLRGEADV